MARGGGMAGGRLASCRCPSAAKHPPSPPPPPQPSPPPFPPSPRPTARRGHAPQYGSSTYGRPERHNALLRILGGTRKPPAWPGLREGAGVALHQDANVVVSEADEGAEFDLPLGAARQGEACRGGWGWEEGGRPGEAQWQPQGGRGGGTGCVWCAAWRQAYATQRPGVLGKRQERRPRPSPPALQQHQHQHQQPPACWPGCNRHRQLYQLSAHLQNAHDTPSALPPSPQRICWRWRAP